MTDSRRSQRRLALDLGVAHALLDADDPDQAIPAILRRLCRTDGWCFAALWAASGGDQLCCKSVWPASTAVARFVSATLRCRLTPGVGRVGQVWATGETLILTDLAGDPYFPRATTAAECDLQQGCLAPVVAASGVIGVLELYRRERWVTGDDTAGLAREVGMLLGRAYERAAALRHTDRDQTALARARFGVCRLLSFEAAQPNQDAAREHRLELLRDVVEDIDQARTAAAPTFIAPEDSVPVPS